MGQALPRDVCGAGGAAVMTRLVRIARRVAKWWNDIDFGSPVPD